MQISNIVKLIAQHSYLLTSFQNYIVHQRDMIYFKFDFSEFP